MSHQSNLLAHRTMTRMPNAATISLKVAGRLLFIDNIRTMLTIHVILFHLLIIYAGVGDWMYVEDRADVVTSTLVAWLITASQAYFMGLFLLISAYFVPGSYDRKGAKQFLADRLIRLGIPLAIYSFLLHPLLMYIEHVYFYGQPWWGYFPNQYFKDEGIIGSGPLWFVLTLLIFSACYVVWRLWQPAPPVRAHDLAPFPRERTIMLFALLLGLASFFVRLWWPIGWTFEPLNLKLSFFAQYIALFVIGLLAYRHNWLLSLPETVGRRWLGLAVFILFLFWPLFIIGGMEQGIDPYMGGWHWQALGYACWEAWLCVSMCIGLIYTFRRYGDHQRPWVAFCARNAYTAYIIHGLVITLLALALRDIMLYPLLKFALVALVALPLCFGLSHLIRQLPYTARVL